MADLDNRPDFPLVSTAEIVSRAQAIALGLKRYFTGKPCCNGHIAERQTSNGVCIACRLNIVKEYADRNREVVLLAKRDWYSRNRERAIATSCEWQENNKEAKRANNRKYLKKLTPEQKAKNAARKKQWALDNREKVKNSRSARIEKQRDAHRRWRSANREIVTLSALKGRASWQYRRLGHDSRRIPNEFGA